MEFISFAHNISYLREQSGLNQTEMQAELGFHRSTWNGYESGKSVPGFADLVRISAYFGILESDLIHTSITDENVNLLHNNYLQTRKDIKKEGNSPLAKSFKTYLQGDFNAITLRLKGISVTESVTKPVTNTPQKPNKSYAYNTETQHSRSLILNEPPTPYNASTPQSHEARIARLEALLTDLKDIFTRYEP